VEKPLGDKLQLEASLAVIEKLQQEITSLRHQVATLQNALTRPCIAMFTDVQLDFLAEFLADAIGEKESKNIVN
jgi:hypothetical protein